MKKLYKYLIKKPWNFLVHYTVLLPLLLLQLAFTGLVVLIDKLRFKNNKDKRLQISASESHIGFQIVDPKVDPIYTVQVKDENTVIFYHESGETTEVDISKNYANIRDGCLEVTPLGEKLNWAKVRAATDLLDEAQAKKEETPLLENKDESKKS